MKNQGRLDQFTLDIEFLLISVIQGVALAALASFAATPLRNLQFEYWSYIVTAFILILIFWSQAIVHVLSFIRWPLDLTHNFLYFLTSFFEVVAFSQMSNPLAWFGLNFIFVLAAVILYFVDFNLIKSRKSNFARSKEGKKLYQDIFQDQRFQLRVFVPLGLAFNALSFLLIYSFPELFLGNRYHVFLSVMQMLFAIVILVASIRSFAKRSKLIAAYDS